MVSISYAIANLDLSQSSVSEASQPQNNPVRRRLSFHWDSIIFLGRLSAER